MPQNDAQDFDNLLGELVDELAMQPIHSGPRPLLDATLEDTPADLPAANVLSSTDHSFAAAPVTAAGPAATPASTGGGSSMVAVTAIVAGAVATVAIAAMVMFANPAGSKAVPDATVAAGASVHGTAGAHDDVGPPPTPTTTAPPPEPGPAETSDARAETPPTDGDLAAQGESEAEADPEAEPERTKPKRTKPKAKRTKPKPKTKPSSGGMSFEDL